MAGRLESFAADEGVSISVKGASAHINGSETLAEEMLYNLIENAVRYNHAGGSVSVRVSQGAASEEVLEALRAAGAEPDPGIGGHGARERYRGGHSRGDARKGVRAVLPSG